MKTIIRSRYIMTIVLLILMLTMLLQMPGQSRAAVGFRISGRNLLDANGNNFVIRGISHPHAWFASQTSSFANIKAKQANAVRVVLTGGRWGLNTASDVANVINLCKTNKLVCVLEDHDTTGYGDDAAAYTLAQAVDYWKSIQSVLTGQEAYIIINIGNEPYGNNNPTAWLQATKDAIAAMRAAGFQHTLMIDAPNWGQDTQFVMKDNAPSVWASDSQRNLIFSIHMYGIFDTAAEIQNYVAYFVNAGLPLVIGEFGNRGVDPNVVMATAQSNAIGYMPWSWSGNSSQARYLDMVNNFDPNSPTTWGTRIFTGADGLSTTSVEASIYGGPTLTPCVTCPTPLPTGTAVPTLGPTVTPGGPNLALNRTTTVSSFFDASTTGAAAVDGNISTNWRTQKSSGLSSEWITVDLGSTKTFSQVVLKWGGNYAKTYTVRVSPDNSTWTTVFTRSIGSGGTETISFSPATARYVQMNSTAWISKIEHIWLYEFEVY
jgi:mannan endo-1,4-beta-mannosidase